MVFLLIMWFFYEFDRWMASWWLSFSRAMSRVIVKVFASVEGSSNMGSIMMVSTMERSPRAPSLNSTALSTM